MVLQGAETGIGVEPGRVLLAEGGEVAVGQGRLLPRETRVGGREEAGLELVDRAVVGAVGGTAPRAGQKSGVVEQAGADERRKVHEVGVARESGETLVGRVAVAGGTERADLPVFHPGGLQEIEEAHRVVVEHAAALLARQAGGLEESAGAARLQPVEERQRRHGF